MLYRIKFGSHCDGRKFYREGSLIESSQDLVKLDPVKFEEVSRRPREVQKVPPRKSEGIALEDLTQEELGMLAKEERIDLTGLDREQSLNVLHAVLGD